MITISKPAKLSQTKYINTLIYGESGIGKTVLCTTAPKPLILATEPGLLSIMNKDVDVAEVLSLAKLKEAYNYLKKDNPYETVCIDSLSELAQVVLSEYKAVERDPRQAYMKMADEIIAIIRQFRDLPMNLVCIAKQDRITDELTGRTIYGPLFPGRMLKSEVPYQLDIVLPMRFHRSEGKTYRVLQTEADIQYNAKDRTGKLDKYEAPDLSALFEKAHAISQASLAI